MTDALATDETLSETVEGGHDGLLLCDGHSIPARFHPLAQLFPMIEGEAFKALVDDVRENGVRRPIVMHEGMILDGRNRYLAAREAGASYRVVDFTGADPIAYVVSENLTRRHLSEAQRAGVAARLAKLPRGANQHASIEAPSQAQAAEMLNVSRASVQRAAEVQRTGAPELVAAVDAGTISVSAAAEVAKLPEAEQVEIVAQGPAAVREAAKAARHPKPATTAEPKEPVDPERRKLARMPDEVKIDEIIGLREENAELRGKLATMKEERDDLKAKLKEATAEDLGRSLGNAQRRADVAEGRMKEYQASAKRMERRLAIAEARVKELENTPIAMGA